MELSKNKKLSHKFSLNFLKFALNFKNSEKNMALIVYVFPKLRTLKEVVR